MRNYLSWSWNPSITSIEAVLIYIILVFTGADFDDYTKNVVAKNLLKKGSNEKHSRDFGRFSDVYRRHRRYHVWRINRLSYRKADFFSRLMALQTLISWPQNLIRVLESSQSVKHVEHMWKSDVRRQGIIPSDERSSSILYLLTVSKCISQVERKRATWGAGRHILPVWFNLHVFEVSIETGIHNHFECQIWLDCGGWSIQTGMHHPKPV